MPPEWAPKIRVGVVEILFWTLGDTAFLKDDLFVDTMMDIFTSGDLNQDGYIDRDEFYQVRKKPTLTI